MRTWKGTVQTLAAVPNQDGCTDFGGMAVAGLQAWGVKVNGAQTLATVYYCKNVSRQVTRTFQVKNLLGHGNSMTANRRYLYFGCWIRNAMPGMQNRYLFRVPRDFNGDWSRGIKVRTPVSVTAFSYFDKAQMIVRVRSDAKGYMKFSIGKITVADDKKSGSMTLTSSLYVKLNTAGAILQDIFFDRKKKLLFIPTVRKNSQGLLVLNRIYIADLAGEHTTVNGHDAFEPTDTVIVNMGPASGFTKFEMESLGLDKNRKIVFSANAAGKTGAHFFRITNLTF